MRDRQIDDASGAVPDFFIEPDFPTNAIYHQLGNGEAKTGSTLRHRPLRTARKETLEDPLMLSGRNPWTLILKGNGKYRRGAH